MTRVLIGIDGSDLALEAARRALDLLGNGPQVTLLQAIQPASMPIAAAPGVAIAPDPTVLDESTDALEADAEANLAGTARELGIDADARVVGGDAGHHLCEVARDERFDVIVVGSHGSGFLKRALLGSVSHHVLHHAPCPVLVVRSPEDGAE